MKPPSIPRGCVLTFRWEDGWDHISFYLGEVGNYVVCLGGNQGDAVWISVYHKKYITGFRIPSDVISNLLQQSMLTNQSEKDT